MTLETAIFAITYVFATLAGHPLRRISSLSSLPSLLSNSEKSQENSPSCRPVGPSEEAQPTWRVPFGVGYVFWGVRFISFSGRGAYICLCGFLCGLLGGAFVLNEYIDCQPKNKNERNQIFQHSGKTVPQRCLLGHFKSACTSLCQHARIVRLNRCKSYCPSVRNWRAPY